MSRTPARHTQADLARALRAVRAAGMQGIAQVEMRPDGTIIIAPLDAKRAATKVEPERDGSEICL